MSGIASSTSLSDLPAEIAPLDLPIHSFVALGDVERIYAELREEIVKLKTKLSKACQDLHHVGHELVQTVENNKKLGDELKSLQLDKQNLVQKLESAMAKLAACDHQIIKNNDAYIAIENELKESKKELLTFKDQLHEAHKKAFESTRQFENLTGEKRVLELNNAKLVAQKKWWLDHVHEEQILLQEERNDFKMQQGFLDDYERSLIEKRHNLEVKEEIVNQQAKEMEKASELRDMEKRLAEKEKYLSEWKLQLALEQKSVDQEKLALLAKKKEFTELQESLSLSQDCFLRFTSGPVMSTMVTANPASSESSGSAETIKHAANESPESNYRHSANLILPPHLRVSVENTRAGVTHPARVLETMETNRTTSVKSASPSFSEEKQAVAVSTRAPTFSSTTFSYRRTCFTSQIPEVFYAKPETRNLQAVKAWLQALEEHGGEVGSTPDDRLINLFRLLADAVTVKPWFCKFCLQDHQMEDLRGVISRYPFPWKALKAAFIEEFGST